MLAMQREIGKPASTALLDGCGTSGCGIYLNASAPQQSTHDNFKQYGMDMTHPQYMTLAAFHT